MNEAGKVKQGVRFGWFNEAKRGTEKRGKRANPNHFSRPIL